MHFIIVLYFPLLLHENILRNPETHSRPTFRDIYLSLSQYTMFVLQIPDDALLTHPQAWVLGAPLEAGEKMYIDLQKSYEWSNAISFKVVHR